MTATHGDDRYEPDGTATPLGFELDHLAPVPPSGLEPPAPRRRRNLVRLVAVAALLAGSVAVLNQRGDDGGNRLEVDEDGQTLPDFEAGVLRPLGPRDGKDSIQLPVTAAPATGLHDGDRVAVSSPGFEPGERVGIVQCAQEAGGDTPETRGGIDGCDVGGVQYADADDEGVALGSIAVSRVLTTPMTGTVDCAAEADRCMVAMGALSDYDRSGGHGIEFATDVDPIVLPTVTVSPSEGLADGDVVHVAADGLTPGSYASLTICSSDPAACWETGDPSKARSDEGRDEDYMGYMGMPVDDRGRLEVDVPVWRFLPGAQPGTYVDCAVSRCSLRLSGETSPPTVPLRFVQDARKPASPALSVVPAEGLAPGDQVVVRGKGFSPGAQLMVSLCAGPVGGEATMGYMGCASPDGSQVTAEADGTFAMQLEIPDLDVLGGYTEDCGGASCSATTTACGPGDCVGGPIGQPGSIRCDGVDTQCYITADLYQMGMGAQRPIFPPSPVPVSFR